MNARHGSSCDDDAEVRLRAWLADVPGFVGTAWVREEGRPEALLILVTEEFDAASLPEDFDGLQLRMLVTGEFEPDAEA